MVPNRAHTGCQGGPKTALPYCTIAIMQIQTQIVQKLAHLSCGFMCNKTKQMRAAIVLQEPARLLQHLFYFTAREAIPLETNFKENIPV